MRLTLKAKLGATFATIVIVSGVSMFVAIQNLGNLNTEIEKIVNGNVKRIQYADGIATSLAIIARAQREHILASTEADKKRVGDRIRTEQDAVRDSVQKIAAIATEEGKRRLDVFTSAFDAFSARSAQIEKLSNLNSTMAAYREMQRGGKIAVTANASLDSLIEKLRQNPDALSSLKDLVISVLQVRRSLRDAVVTMADPAEQQNALKDLDDSVAAFRRQLEQTGALIPADQTSFKTYKESMAKWLASIEETRRIAVENGVEKALSLAAGDGEKARLAARDAIDKLVALNQEQMAKAAAGAVDLYNFSRNLLIGLLIGMTVLAIGAATWIVLNISRAVQSALGLAHAVASGDLNGHRQREVQ